MTTVSFSVLLNGSPFDFFRPACGLRQGDPLSHFLFILGSEVLSRLLGRAELSGLIHGIKVSRATPFIHHLLFADDLLIFSRANAREAVGIQSILDQYSHLSGQKMNQSKSFVFLQQKYTLGGGTVSQGDSTG